MAGPGLDVKAILAKVEPAVVDIETEGGRAVGEGTGIVFASDGFILTNAHVVSGASRVTVTAGQRALPARLVGTDEAHDVAVLRVETGDGAGLTVAELGRSADVAVGDDVVAIGNALGLRGDPSVTRGIVSALGRSIGPLTGMIQTDAAINPGNSGGPLVNSRGQVIGLNTAVANGDRAQNIGFAIPIDTARTIAARLADGQPPAPTAFLGVTTADAIGGNPGAVVADVAPGSPAAAAGLATGDRIVAVDGMPVPGAAELRGLIQAHQPGETVSLRVVRGGREVTLEAKLVTQPASN
jgi:putative serine protease PepD